MKLYTTLRNLIKTPVALLGIVVFIAYASYLGRQAYNSQVIVPWNDRALNHVSNRANVLADQFSGHLNKITARLKNSTEQELILKGLRSHEKSVVEATEDHLRNSWPMLEGVSFFKPFEEYPTALENYVAASLLRQSNAGEYPAPVAIKLEDVWTVFVSMPVFPADSHLIAGSVVVNFPASRLTASTNEADEHGGLIEIRQKTRGFSPQIIFSQGTGKTKLKTTVPIAAATGWELSYTAPSTLMNETPRPLAYFTASLFFIVLVTILLIGLLLRYSARMAENLGTFFSPNTMSPGDLSSEQLNKLVDEKLRSINKGEDSSISVNTTNTAGSVSEGQYPAEVFRSYDIRGNAQTQITTQFAEALGKTLGTKAADLNSPLVVAADGRVSSPKLSKALMKGILSTGCNVIDLGRVPTPVFNFGIQHITDATSGVIVTASHNPAEDNGFKLIFEGNVLAADEINQLAQAMSSANWLEGDGRSSEQNVVEAYCEAITDDVVVATPLHVVVDCANGAMSDIAPHLLETLGCQVTPLYCEVDGEFPNHQPDPSNPDNLKDLIAIVAYENADLGLAFDGDGDRLVAISASGRVIWPDELLMIFSKDILARQPGSDIVFDVKSTRRLRDLINSYGGRPIMCKTGHSNMRRKIIEANAPLGGEYSGHIFFHDRWFGFDDGLYAAARLIEIIGLREQSLDEMMDSFETSVATPEIKVPVLDQDKFAIIEKLCDQMEFQDGTVSRVDGLRVEFAGGWGLVRASNTSSSLSLRFEADDDSTLKSIKRDFKKQIKDIVPDITLPF